MAACEARVTILPRVERGEERDAHQDARGDAGQERSGQPAGGNFPPIGRAAAAGAVERRLVSQFPCGQIEVVHAISSCGAPIRRNEAADLQSVTGQLPAGTCEVNEAAGMAPARPRLPVSAGSIGP